MFKIVATRCHLLRLKCTKFNFGWGSAPDPAGGAYSVLDSKEPTSKGRGMVKKGGRRRGKGKGRERRSRREGVQ